MKSEKRPIVKNKTKEEIYDIYLERKEKYLNCDYILDVSNKSPWESGKEAAKIFKLLKNIN